MRFIDLFAGIGGFRKGMELAGHRCVGFCEIDKHAHNAYKIVHGTEGEWEAYDIRSVSDESIRGIGSVDVITGGFPCQAFSVAGKRGGFQDTRGTLFFEIMRFASILRPRYLFLENVPGLLNHDNGNTFETILRTLDEVGYDAEWDVLNSKDYRVPQNRERVFLIGHLRGECTRKVFPLKRENGGTIKVVGQLEGKFRPVNEVLSLDGISTCLNTMQGGNREPKVLVNVNNGLLQKRDDFTCLDANYAKRLDNHAARTGVMEIRPILTPDREEKHQNGRRMKEPDEPMFTLTAQDRHGVAISIDLKSEHSSTRRGMYKREYTGTLDTNCSVAVTKGHRIRRLTPLECFRLQGFPDEWYYKLRNAGVSDSQLYKMAGNAVTVNVIFAIAKELQT
jgi:DNA (cytosine-5)-methyltransferase 1